MRFCNLKTYLSTCGQLIVSHPSVFPWESDFARILSLRLGKLQSAKESRAYQEYQASVNAARRVEEYNQAQLNYQRQLAEYEQRIRDKQFQTAQIQGRLDDVDNAIASLAQVKAPYGGTVRRVKWLGQSPDGSLTAEVTLMVRNSQ